MICLQSLTSTILFYIYSLQCYLEGFCISAKRKIVNLKIICPLQLKFYARNGPIAVYLIKIKYKFYCLNLTTDFDPGLDEVIHYKSNYKCMTNKPPNCFASPFSTSESYKTFLHNFFFRQTDTVLMGHFLALPLKPH